MKKDDLPILPVITGPTATGKTRLAVNVALHLKGEVISADSRQVFRGMDIGTGKDLSDFTVGGHVVPCHLIDIADPGEVYSVYAFQKDFVTAFRDICARAKQPVLCGGTGLYVEAAISGYRMLRVPENKALRESLEQYDMPGLIRLLRSMKKLHNITDISDRDRLVRAIEIEKHHQEHNDQLIDYPKFTPVVFAIHFERPVIRARITARLEERLKQGMLDEVDALLKQGLKPAQLMFYGLEYRYLTIHLMGQITYDEMFNKLNTAIHQFAKRQMTWFRRMERNGTNIHWLDGTQGPEENTREVLQVLSG